MVQNERSVFVRIFRFRKQASEHHGEGMFEWKLRQKVRRFVRQEVLPHYSPLIPYWVNSRSRSSGIPSFTVPARKNQWGQALEHRTRTSTLDKLHSLPVIFQLHQISSLTSVDHTPGEPGVGPTAGICSSLFLWMYSWASNLQCRGEVFSLVAFTGFARH